MSDSSGASRLVLNAVVLVALVLTIGAVTDYAAVWMGFDPPVGCALLMVVATLAATVGIVLAWVGVVALLLLPDKGIGATLLVGGLLVGILPQIVDGYLTRFLGRGCKERTEVTVRPLDVGNRRTWISSTQPAILLSGEPRQGWIVDLRSPGGGLRA